MRRNSVKDRRTCFERYKFERDGRILLTCCFCLHEFEPAREKWEAHHIVRHTDGGTHEDCMPAHYKCHRVHTGQDQKVIAHGKRMGERHYGIRRSGGGFRGWRKFDGTPVWKRGE